MEDSASQTVLEILSKRSSDRFISNPSSSPAAEHLVTASPVASEPNNRKVQFLDSNLKE